MGVSLPPRLSDPALKVPIGFSGRVDADQSLATQVAEVRQRLSPLARPSSIPNLNHDANGRRAPP